MKKIILSLVTLMLFSQASFAAHPQGLKELIDNYQYSIEVEWDQKDPAFLEQQNQMLTEGIKSLVAQGQNPRELLEEVLADIPNEQFKADVRAGLAVAAREQLAPEQLNEMILMAAANTHAQGAAWSVWAKIGVGVVATIVVARIALEIYFYEWGKRL